MGPSLGFWSIALCRTPEAAISQSTEDTRHILSGESNGSHYLRHHKAAMLRPWCIEAVTPGQLQTIGNLFWNRSNNSMWPPRNHRRVTSWPPGHLVTFANKKKATSFEAAQDEEPALIDFASQAIKNRWQVGFSSNSCKTYIAAQYSRSMLWPLQMRRFSPPPMGSLGSYKTRDENLRHLNAMCFSQGALMVWK